MAAPEMTGMMNKMLDELADKIAASESFRTWYGAGNVAVAKAMIGFRQFTIEDLPRPNVLIDYFQLQGAGVAMTKKPTMDFIIIFETDTPEAYVDNEGYALTDFDNKSSPVIVDIGKRSVDPRLLNFRVQSPAHSDEREIAKGNDYLQQMVFVTAG